jgi:hypothetical protein
MTKKTVAKWKENMPWELESRFIDMGQDDYTLAEAIQEAEYVIDMIQSGGSSYNDDEDEGKAVLKELKTFVRKYKRYARQ